MKRKTFSVVSSSDGLILDGLAIIPDKVNGVVQIAHGMSEHKERYIEFMEYLAEHGYASVIHDHRGHGKSLKSIEDQGYFYEKTGNYIVEDLYDVTQWIQNFFEGEPLYLLGHSMGSLVVRLYLKKHDSAINKLIVCGSPSKNPMVPFAILFVNVLEKFYGDHHRSSLVQNLAFGSFDKRFPGEKENSWLSTNDENVLAYNESKKDGFVFTLNGFLNLFHMMKDVYDSKGWDCKNKNIPIFFIAGKEDPVIVSEKEWYRSQDFLKQVGYTNICSHIYENMRHEILKEKNRKIVFKDIVKFLEQ